MAFWVDVGCSVVLLGLCAINMDLWLYSSSVLRLFPLVHGSWEYSLCWQLQIKERSTPHSTPLTFPPHFLDSSIALTSSLPHSIPCFIPHSFPHSLSTPCSIHIIGSTPRKQSIRCEDAWNRMVLDMPPELKEE